MKRKIGLLLIACFILAIQPSGLRASDPSPEQVIAAHLKSIGAPEVLSQIQSISFVGTSDVTFILGMSGQLAGTSVLVSEGPRMSIIMRFSDINYPEEYFAHDGRSVTVGNIKPGLRSPLADFLFRYDRIMKNGILGGVFSNAWPLLDVRRSNPRLMRVRQARVDGVSLYELEYRPRDSHGDMTIRFFFDTETYQHVRTEYKVVTKDDLTTGSNPDLNDPNTMNVPGMPTAQIRGESYYTLVERFGDFRKVGELTMPYSYTLEYMIDGMNQSGFIARWKIDVLELGFNMVNFDQEIFKAGR